jgi:hypothetical protein
VAIGFDDALAAKGGMGKKPSLIPTATARTRYTRPPEGHADGAPEGLTRGYEGIREIDPAPTPLLIPDDVACH